MAEKIFDERGFLTAQGKELVDEGFVKEVKRVFATASTYGDTLTISCILKSIVSEHATNQCYAIRNLEATRPVAVSQPPSVPAQGKVIPFPKRLEPLQPLKPLKPLTDLNNSLNELSDIPPIDE